MPVTVMPSGKAPPGRLRSGVGAMALVTAFPVSARGSHAEVEGGRGVGEHLGALFGVRMHSTSVDGHRVFVGLPRSGGAP